MPYINTMHIVCDSMKDLLSNYWHLTKKFWDLISLFIICGYNSKIFFTTSKIVKVPKHCIITRSHQSTCNPSTVSTASIASVKYWNRISILDISSANKCCCLAIVVRLSCKSTAIDMTFRDSSPQGSYLPDGHVIQWNPTKVPSVLLGIGRLFLVASLVRSQ